MVSGCPRASYRRGSAKGPTKANKQSRNLERHGDRNPPEGAPIMEGMACLSITSDPRGPPELPHDLAQETTPQRVASRESLRGVPESYVYVLAIDPHDWYSMVSPSLLVNRCNGEPFTSLGPAVFPRCSQHCFQATKQECVQHGQNLDAGTHQKGQGKLQ